MEKNGSMLSKHRNSRCSICFVVDVTTGKFVVVYVWKLNVFVIVYERDGRVQRPSGTTILVPSFSKAPSKVGFLCRHLASFWFWHDDWEHVPNWLSTSDQA